MKPLQQISILQIQHLFVKRPIKVSQLHEEKDSTMILTTSVLGRRLLAYKSLAKARPAMIRLLSKSSTLGTPDFSDRCSLNILSRFVCMGHCRCRDCFLSSFSWDLRPFELLTAHMPPSRMVHIHLSLSL